jgi:hypothetical protein
MNIKKNQPYKNVGIVTMHKVTNFGSVLQAYALQKVISDLGYNCELIDYVYPNKYHKQFRSKEKWYSFAKFLVPSRFLSNTHRDQKNIKQFWKTHFKLSHTYYSKEELQQNPPHYDIYLTGSDQVWNPHFVKGDTSFLLSFAPESAKKIAYSASFACAQIEDKYALAYKELLNKYSKISVREINGQNIIKNLTGKYAPVTLDPTLLLTPEEWDILCATENKTYKINNDYIFAYVLDYAINCTPYIYELIKHMKKVMNCSVIYLDQKEKLPEELSGIVERPYAVTPITFVSLLKNAKLVITSSFHGTSFAANFGVPLYSIVSNDTSKDSRQLSLLAELEISNRAIPINTPFDKIENSWDSEKLQSNLVKLRKLSNSYLLHALEN